jgi:8-oxo-dGTP pyrophosphatase MutT (NUDIX family)
VIDRPHLSLAAAAVIFDGRRVLLVRQGYARRRWSLPGGVLEAAESPDEAAIREVYEETGLHISLRHLVGIYYLRRSQPGLGFAFLGERIGVAPPVAQSPEIAELGWFDPASLPTPAVESLETVIDDAAQGRVGCFRTLDVQATWTASDGVE